MEATQNVWHGNVQTSTDTLVPIESAVSSPPVDIARGTRVRYDSETLEHVSATLYPRWQPLTKIVSHCFPSSSVFP